MTGFPGSPALGRGIVISAGAPSPELCGAWPRIVIDDEVTAEPAETAEELHGHWLTRRPVVVVLEADPAELRRPEACSLAPWRLDAGFTFQRERLQYLVWSNNYDGRTGEPIWWHARRAERLGARAVGPADVLLPDGTPAWCDGGPRQLLDPGPEAVVHRESIESGSLRPDARGEPATDLAPDQLAAVSHPVGAARIIAPAGSGKTRVLTERLRHLLVDRRVTPGCVTAVAYNKRAADQLSGRTAGLPAHVRTLNSLGLAVLSGSGPFASTTTGPRQVIEEPDVRRLLESLVEVRRQANTDPLAPYLDALSAIRLGLADPLQVEEAIPDAAGVAEVFDRYRAVLADRGLVDFDEQVYAAIELLLIDPETRAHDQRACRHLLVDEFQDLTPAHLLLLRLLAAPTFNVFGVGDDDQVIYSYAGARPEFLLDYDRFFPGASAYALEVNYRCPAPVVDAARNLLSYNHRRIPKVIRAAGIANERSTGFQQERRPDAEHTTAAVEHLRRWATGGSGWSEMAILTRVNSALLPAQVTLMEEEIPCTAPLNQRFLGRTGIRAALAYLRIGVSPERISRTDVADTIRRPSRRIARNVSDMLQRRPNTSLDEIRRLATALSGADVDRLRSYAGDLAAVVDAVAGGDTASALAVVRRHVGLGQAMDVLDGSRREADRSTHADDLAALEQVAVRHPDPATFETWLGDVLARPGVPDGVMLSTVHRVKGQEWPYVIVLGADAGSFPHRLATSVEEERRIFHVAITRAGTEAVVIADTDEPSPFCDELTGRAPNRPDRIPGRRATGAGRAGRPAPVTLPTSEADASAVAALKAWRKETATRDKVPAYVVLSDQHLEGIAAVGPSTLEELAGCRGIGPAKLERYGDEILALLQDAESQLPVS